jgi:hypothetical protein
MTSKVFALDTKPGIQRDGTVFDKDFYVDGRWVRFQRGRPRKIGGYREILATLAGPSRGMYLDPQSTFTNVYSGYAYGLQLVPINNDGIGTGLLDLTLSNFTLNDRNMWQFDALRDSGGGGNDTLVAHPGQNLTDIDNRVNTPVLAGAIGGTTMSQVGVFQTANSYLNNTTAVTLSSLNDLIGAGQTVTGTGISPNTEVVSTAIATDILASVAVTGTAGTFSCTSTSGLFVGQTVQVAGALGNITLSAVTVTGTAGTFSCTATTGLYVGQAVNVTGTTDTQTLASVAITSGAGEFSCTATTGLAVDQAVLVTGIVSTQTLASVAITSNEGAFSCTATTGLYVGMPMRVSGTQTAATLAGVAVTGTAGECSCTATNGLYIGQPVVVTGTLTGTATGVAGNQVYYIIATDGTSTFTLSLAPGGTAIVTTAGTTTGLTFKATLFSGIASNATYYVIATNGTSTFTLSASQNGPAITTVIVGITGLTFTGQASTGITPGLTYYIAATNGTSTFSLSTTRGGTAISGTYGSTTGLTFKTYPYAGVVTGTTYYIIATNGTSTFTLSATSGGAAITTVVTSVAGLVFTAPKSIGLTSGTTYYIIATNYSTTFTLSATASGSAVTTVVTPTTGFVFTLGPYQKVILNNSATASGASVLTFNNNIAVSGGVVSLHPYLFVYGNNGLIKNCSAGDLQNWVAADANETNAASTKIVQGLPVRGGSNAPSGLFWSLDSVIRVSYAPTTVGASQIYWRYDIISSQSSILSSQSVIEYDGVYYWCGVDRFLMYNGVVKEIPNNMNQNYFFDNLNYAQRQKVYATKVPRFGEIWWFYPEGDATECTNAVIYNVRENCWYDAGNAPGARRSAGYFSQVFHYPVNADWTPNVAGMLKTLTIANAGSGYTNGTYTNVTLTGGSGLYGTANITVSGGAVTAVAINNAGVNYVAGDILGAPSLPAGAGFSLTATHVVSKVSLYQHEVGVDELKSGNTFAIESYFETNDLGLVSGGPSQPSAVGENVWLRLERVEPDFILSGEMSLFVVGRPYAQEDDYTSQAYTFDANTGKIDMKEQRRELRLRFVSNTQAGDYQVGKVLLNADAGDVRGY